MSTLRNSVHLIGNLGMDPEIKEFSGNRKMAKFSLATKDNFRNNKGEKVEDTQWHNIIIWGKTAEVAEKYLKKGKEVAVGGKLVHRVYEDKEGVKKYFTEVVVSELLLLGNGKSN